MNYLIVNYRQMRITEHLDERTKCDATTFCRISESQYAHGLLLLS